MIYKIQCGSILLKVFEPACVLTWRERCSGQEAGRCRKRKATISHSGWSRLFNISFDDGGEVVGGMSGSPVVYNGEIIGVVTHGGRPGLAYTVSASRCPCSEASSLPIMDDPDAKC